MALQYPDDFRCPISLEVMTDPVILPSGHTFDRTSIQRWLESGNLTCPVTMLALPPHPSLIPNHALRSLISTFPKPSAAAAAVLAAAADPKSISFPSDPATLSAVLRLAKRDADFRRRLAESGASSVLLRHAGDRRRPDLQDLSLRVLLHLTLDGDDARVGLVAEGAVDRLAAALHNGSSASAALAATVLTSLAVVEVNKCTIGVHPSAIRGLASLLHKGGRERREAATALYELCKFPENRRLVVRAGSVPALIHLAGSGSDRAVEVLGLLAKCREGREEMGRCNDLVKVLARVLQESSLRGVEHALSVLILLLSHSDDMALALAAVKAGIPEICTGLIGEEENGRIAMNALGLSRIFEKIVFIGFE